MPNSLPPGLYIVATPIGNLGDLSPRAADTLRQCDLVLAEDTRVSGKLLAHAGAKTPMRSYHDHSDERERDAIVERLGSEAIALISDAGTPLISDPGYKLVREARAAGREIRTIPGPCAAVAALTLSGLPTDRFLFAGFLPAKSKARAEALADLAGIHATLLFYESGPRIADTLLAMAEAFGDRPGAVAREITKLHEQCVDGSLTALAERWSHAAPRGEMVIAVGPPPEEPPATDDELESALREALQDLSPSRAASEVAKRIGVPRKRAYALALKLAREP